ncbi:MAG TPA: hypothetical protein VH186_22650 [Chloroflexia bacterium]|nr:hypothetical protein [Chloroflexia bacterium]
MYVKWVVRKHKNEELANIVFYDAYLVQSYKNEAGDPRQRTIAYLGNLRQIDGQFPVIERALFYIRMEDGISRNVPAETLTEEERQKLYAGLATVAPAPTEQEIRHSEMLNQHWHQGFWRARALRPTDISSGFAQIVDESGQTLLPTELKVSSTICHELDPVAVIGRLADSSRRSS